MRAFLSLLQADICHPQTCDPLLGHCRAPACCLHWEEGSWAPAGAFHRSHPTLGYPIPLFCAGALLWGRVLLLSQSRFRIRPALGKAPAREAAARC